MTASSKLRPARRQPPLREGNDPARKNFLTLDEFTTRSGMERDAVLQAIRHGRFFAVKAHGKLLIHVNALRAVLETRPSGPRRSLWGQFAHGEAKLEDAFWFWGTPTALMFLLLFQTAPVLGAPLGLLKLGALLYLPLHISFAWFVWACRRNTERSYWRPISLAIVIAWSWHLYRAAQELSAPLVILDKLATVS